MRKYIKVFTVSVQNALEYKENFICTILFSMIPCFTNLLLWYAVLKSNAGSLEMNLSELISYYLCTLFIDNLTCNNLIWKIPPDIRLGDLNKYLMKPIRYERYMLFCELSQNIIFLILIGIPMLICMFIFRNKLSISLTIANFVFFIIAIIIGYMINFLLNYLLCTLAFYMTDISSLCISADVLKGLVTGKVFPINLVPKGLYSILIITPFQYICYFPVMILLNKYSINEMAKQILLGCVWVVILYLLSKIIWKKGLNKYSALGG